MFKYQISYIDASSEKILQILVNDEGCKSLDREDLEQILFLEEESSSSNLTEKVKEMVKWSDDWKPEAR